ncbi:hypothetical protein SODALDRAFT_330950 [Sodiomyces alkalinus F11]|uniref:RRM domain-containing protein n=1 Tax=Sodiomyces alkalinus (strain CBS 110278 / VKM F-3762 / F11) TaxID=1314773 RepID=A0A3N2Q390_SODAK|nr:hypothetical protein SODALDRAFT_330950 [Sodiomyces alkalinus F11]ROT41229.1 hypothetical protein SODALDRAFT_330950 [Sodiomyces alkalinus F11]
MSSSDSERPSEPMSPDTTSASKKRKAELEELEVDLKAPEPPSKRARRALKKGKTLPPKPTSDDENEGSKSKSKDGASDSEAEQNGEPKTKKKTTTTTTKKKDAAATRSEHGVWVGNLPFDATPAEMQKWLVDNAGGAITAESITRVHMPTTTKHVGWQGTKTNKGFAYVDFTDVGSKVAAIALTENELRHRKLLIKDASSYEGRPKKEANADGGGDQKNPPQAKKPTSRKIFVGNLGFATTEEDVRSNFEKCGDIDWVKIATFEDSGKCKGYGWVMFREPEAAEWAVKGFVKIKEETETEDDFVTKDADDDNEEEEKEEEEEEEYGKEEKEKEEEEGDDKAKKEKKGKENKKQPKMRKWWVNRIMGRNLKIELAEDDQTRYKKRYGKDAVKRPQQKTGKQQSAQATNGHAGDVEPEHKAKTRPAPARELKVQEDLMVARLTGTAAKPTGTKITFD